MSEKLLGVATVPVVEQTLGEVFTLDIPAGMKVLYATKAAGCWISLVGQVELARNGQLPSKVKQRYVLLNPDQSALTKVTVGRDDELQFVCRIDDGLLFEVVALPPKLPADLRADLIKALTSGHFYRVYEFEVALRVAINESFDNLTLRCKTFAESVGQVLDYCLANNKLTELIAVCASRELNVRRLESRLRTAGYIA